MNEAHTAVIIFSIAGIVFMALGVPLFQQRVPPNSWYGCRTTKSLSDKKIWYAVNRVTGRDMIIIGMVVIVSALVVLLFGARINSTYAAMILLFILVCATIGMVVNSIRTLKRL